MSGLRWVYGLNEPLRFSDPTGLEGLDDGNGYSCLSDCSNAPAQDSSPPQDSTPPGPTTYCQGDICLDGGPTTGAEPSSAPTVTFVPNHAERPSLTNLFGRMASFADHFILSPAERAADTGAKWIEAGADEVKPLWDTFLDIDVKSLVDEQRKALTAAAEAAMHPIGEGQNAAAAAIDADLATAKVITAIAKSTAGMQDQVTWAKAARTIDTLGKVGMGLGIAATLLGTAAAFNEFNSEYHDPRWASGYAGLEFTGSFAAMAVVAATSPGWVPALAIGGAAAVLTIDAQTGMKYYYERRNDFSWGQAKTDYWNTYQKPRNLASLALLSPLGAVAGHEVARDFGLSGKLQGWI